MLAESEASIANGIAAPAAVRGCGGCTLCCKVMAVKPLNKPSGTWCQHCTTGAGCGIYEQRPAECAAFICGYLSLPELSEEWKPAVSRLIISTFTTGNRINVYVDPARPDAWRRQPYYASLQAWAARTLAKRGQVVVRVGNRSIAILPDHAVDLGEVADDELIVVLGAKGTTGPTHEAYVVKREVAKAADANAIQPGAFPLPIGGIDGFRAGRRID
jgi:hypothetical protein